ncbi:hypothetical protein ACR30L_08250 [Psychromonas sp. PT13]|uniref:hypothetical protein n=1 Tax=Psychromonas sp. PT13 TaxID=3439547 RepID=UPI003EBD6C11
MAENKENYWLCLRKECLKVPFKAVKNPKFVFSFLIIMIISSGGIWAPWAFSLDLSSACNSEVNVVNNNVQVQSENIELAGYYFNWGATVTSTATSTYNISTLKESLENSCEFISSLPVVLFQGFAIFMFNLGILGGIAFEFFVKLGPDKYDELETDHCINKNRTNEFAGYFAWLIAFVLSFYGLKEPTTTSYLAMIGSFIAISLWIITNYDKADFKDRPVSPGNIEAAGSRSSSKSSKEKLPGEGLK